MEGASEGVRLRVDGSVAVGGGGATRVGTAAAAGDVGEGPVEERGEADRLLEMGAVSTRGGRGGAPGGG